MSTAADTQAQTEVELQRLAYLYARAMDRNEPALLGQALSDDVTMEGPGFSTQGLEQAQSFPPMLDDMYLLTQHVVNNQTVTVNGGQAEGETYCTATHILRPEAEGGQAPEGQYQALVWAIRYQDRFRRDNGQWRISHRQLIIDWTEMRTVSLPA